MQSGLEQSQLKQIWELCDKAEEGTQPTSGKGFLKRNEWIVCLHLITYSKKGWPLPKILPHELEQFLSNYREVRMQSEQGFGSHSYINLGNSQGSLSQSYSLNQPVAPSYQSTALTDVSQVQRANTGPSSISNDAYGTNMGMINSQVIRSTTAQSGDVTALTSLLDRVIKGYELLAKKYSDETDTFMETFSKLGEERRNVFQEISLEIELLAKELEDSVNVRNSIVNEAQNAIAKSKDTTVTDGLAKIAQTLSSDSQTKETHEVLRLLKERLEAGSFPIRVDSLPEPIHQRQDQSQPLVSTGSSSLPQRLSQTHVQESSNYRGQQPAHQEEEDMFA